MLKLSTRNRAHLIWLSSFLMILQHFAKCHELIQQQQEQQNSTVQNQTLILEQQQHEKQQQQQLEKEKDKGKLEIVEKGPYCDASLCELSNGTDTYIAPHIGCNNNGTFSPVCGYKPHLLYMSERRRQLILDMHNLARSRIASGILKDYNPATRMPQIKWDNELEYLATLHVKRCKFAHDECRNSNHYRYSGQNIGYFWIGREFKSHSKRMKWFIISWFREYLDANQTFIDSYQSHPDGKKIGHFTLLVADRVHRVGCAAIRFRDPQQPSDMKFLMTCNYDYNNIYGEPIYQSGPTASQCTYKRSEKFPALCDWKDQYDSDESVEDDNNTLDNNIVL